MEIQWPLVIFTICITLSAGMFGGLGLLGLIKREIGRKAARLVIILSAIVLAIGGAASFLHLQHWERAFNGFGHITSGITHELIGAVVMFILFVVAFTLLSKSEKLPTWLNAVALLAGVGFVLLMANSYYMPARPVWASFALYLYYLAQALLLGSVGLWAILAALGEKNARLLARWTVATAVIQLVAVGIYAAVIAGTTPEFPQWGNYFDWTDPNRPATDYNLINRLLTGEVALLFWGGAIAAGAIIPALLGLLCPKGSQSGSGSGSGSKLDSAQGSGSKGSSLVSTALAVVAIVCVLGGGVAFRAILYLLGLSVVPF